MQRRAVGRLLEADERVAALLELEEEGAQGRRRNSLHRHPLLGSHTAESEDEGNGERGGEKRGEGQAKNMGERRPRRGGLKGKGEKGARRQ